MNHAGTSLNRHAPATPGAISKLVKCSECGNVQSLGQYEVGESICKTCAPKPAGWRRGGIDNAQFQERDET